MNFTVQTIPQMLVATHGNQTEVSRRLSCDRGTVQKYSRDLKGQNHAIVNGVLMIHQGGRGIYERD
jgi:Phage NinH protein.